MRWPRFRLKKEGTDRSTPSRTFWSMTSLRKTSSSSGSSYSSGSSGSASMRSADGPPYAFLLESGPSPSPGLFTPLMVFALRSRGLSDVFFKRYALGHASTRERGLHRSVRKRSRGFLHDASLKLGLSRATRGLVPHRRVPEWGPLSVRWVESFHEKVSVPIPAKCDNLVLGDSKRWRTLERIAGTRQRHTKSRRAPAPKRKRSFSPKKLPRP